MSKSLKSEMPWTVADVATRRIKENAGGLGTLAARDYFKKFPAQRPATVAKPGDARRYMHIREIQSYREQMIASGQIKPVEGE